MGSVLGYILAPAIRIVGLAALAAIAILYCLYLREGWTAANLRLASAQVQIIAAQAEMRKQSKAMQDYTRDSAARFKAAQKEMVRQHRLTQQKTDELLNTKEQFKSCQDALGWLNSESLPLSQWQPPPVAASKPSTKK